MLLEPLQVLLSQPLSFSHTPEAPGPCCRRSVLPSGEVPQSLRRVQRRGGFRSDIEGLVARTDKATIRACCGRR